MSWPKLLLLRHGETEWNLAGRIQGSLDSSLTALGREQAAAQGRILARVLPDFGDAALFVSPLERARATAGIALPGAAPVIDPRLREIHCGSWEGLTPEERRQGWPAIAAACTSDLALYDRAPGGEGLDLLTERLTGFLNDLPGPSIIVAHKVVLIVLRGILRRLKRQALHDLEAPQGVVLQIENGLETVLR